MVEQMVNPKLSKYGVGKCGSLLDKQPLVAIKKTGLRDLQNDNKTVFSKPSGNFPSLRETEPPKDSTQILGAKFPTPDRLLSPPRPQSPGSSNLVYARRKSDADPIKSRVSDKNHASDHKQLEQFSEKGAEIKDPKSDGVSAVGPIPANSTANSCGALLLNSTPKQDHQDLQVVRDQHWRDRFIQLQTFLKCFDNSNQEAYVQMIKSFTSEERSRHAVELEKRAIHLSLEEGREMQRMKALNVLGKSAPNNYPPSLSSRVKAEK